MTLREAKIRIKVEYKRKDGNIEQHFILDGGIKEKNAIRKPQYEIYDRFIKRINEESLVKYGFEYLNDRDEKDKLIVTYVDKPDYKIPDPYFFNIFSYLPPNDGCAYCRYKQGVKGFPSFVKCDFYKKTFTKHKKQCKYFMQDRSLNKT